jgi:hypothetical protein
LLFIALTDPFKNKLFNKNKFAGYKW